MVLNPSTVAGPLHGLQIAVPRWSPDGRWVAFTSNRTGDADNNGRVDLWLAAADGTGGFRRLAFGDVAARSPCWSPDGRQLAFVSTLEPESMYRLTLLMTVALTDGQELAALPVADGFASIGGVDGVFHVVPAFVPDEAATGLVMVEAAAEAAAEVAASLADD